jgi:fused signal recognition particle receptor
MGFFDKIKKALVGDSKKEQPVDSVESPESAEITETPESTDSNQSTQTETPVEKTTETSDEAPTDQESAASVEESSEAKNQLVSPSEDQPVAENAMPAAEVEPQASVEPANEVQEKYNKGLSKSRKTFGQRLNELFANFRSVDEDFFEEVEETLIGADVGFDAAIKITDAMRQEVKLRNVKKPADVQNVIIEKLVDLYGEAGIGEVNELNMQPGLTVILFVGVNGVGKTTSIGKLAHQFKGEGKKVLMAAADTFRAGAIDQLVVWGERAGVEVVRGKAGGDPAAVVFDAMERAKAEEADVLLVDTAGRLQNKVNLMNELEKIKRIIQRVEPNAPHEVLLVLDATTGQNAMNQAKQFKETTDVTGLVLTKLDGTAKGGIVLAIRNELRLPVKLVGLGEGINDLEPFDPNEFVVGLFKGLIQE